MSQPQKPKKKFMFLGVGVVPKLRFQTTSHRVNRPIFDLTALVTIGPSGPNILIDDEGDFLIDDDGDTLIYG